MTNRLKFPTTAQLKDITQTLKPDKRRNPDIPTSGAARKASPPTRSQNALKGLSFDRFMGLRTAKAAPVAAASNISPGKVKKAAKSRRKALEMAKNKTSPPREETVQKTSFENNRSETEGHVLPGIFFPAPLNPAAFTIQKGQRKKPKKKAVKPVLQTENGARPR